MTPPAGQPVRGPATSTKRAIELIKAGATASEAARATGVALNTIYRSALYKAWRLEKAKL